MAGDMVVDPAVYSPLAVHNTGIGVEIEEDIVKTDADNIIVSHRYHNQIRDEDDVGRIQLPQVTHDAQKTEENYKAYCEIFDGVLSVEKRGTPGFWFAPWDDLVMLTGAQDSLLNLAMRPEFVHKAIDRLVTAYLGALDQYEALGLLTLNNNNVRIGSGAYGYTDELPQNDFDPDHIRTKDIWGSATAQIFSGVSPQMHDEFALAYEIRWLERFGLTYYGCCEPLDNKIEILERIPNLRKISMSPWNKMEEAAERISDRYVFSLKPSPAIFAEAKWHPDLARKELETNIRIAKDHGCHVEVIMKDISTVHHEPHRLWEWAQIASEVTEQLA
jgi:hypothetical protein